MCRPAALAAKTLSSMPRLQAFVEDRRRFTTWLKKRNNKSGLGRKAPSSAMPAGLNASMSRNSSSSSPWKLGRGGAGDMSGTWTSEDGVHALSYLHDLHGAEDGDRIIISKMMEEMMLTSEKAFGAQDALHALDARHPHAPSPQSGPALSPGGRDRLQAARPWSATAHYRDSPQVPRRPKSAGPVLWLSGPGSAASRMGAEWEREGNDMLDVNNLDNTLEQTARPFLKLRTSLVRPQRLEENWVQLGLSQARVSSARAQHQATT